MYAAHSPGTNIEALRGRWHVDRQSRERDLTVGYDGWMAPAWLIGDGSNRGATWVTRLTAVVAIVYFATGWLGLLFPYYGSYVTLVWAPTAIALAAVVLVGPIAMLGVFLGSFAINVSMVPELPGPAALLALINALAPGLAGVALVHRYEFRPQLDRLRDAFAFMGIGVVATGLVTATAGALLLCSFDRAPWADFPIVWLTWFGGETAGSLVVAPLLFTWLSQPDPAVDGLAGVGERWGMAISIVVFSAIVLSFGEELPSLPYGFGLLFLWTLFRAGRRGISLAVLGVAIPLVGGTAFGIGPFVVPTPRAGMWSLWMTMAVAGSACCTASALLADRDRALQSQRRLLAELDHRVKNALATVVALAERSRDEALDIDEFRARFVARVRAIARTHEGLARSNWEPMPVKDVVAMTLAPFADATADHLWIDGDGIALTPSSVTPLTMVLHELATNAAKYGAWSRDGGKVEVAWASGGDDSLRLDWRESGGPKLSATPTPGYGLKLIEGIVDHQLGGEAKIAFRESGLLCTLHIPIGRS